MKDTLCGKNNRYQKLDKLGEGTYGIVFKAKDIISKQVFF